MQRPHAQKNTSPEERNCSATTADTTTPVHLLSKVALAAGRSPDLSNVEIRHNVSSEHAAHYAQHERTNHRPKLRRNAGANARARVLKDNCPRAVHAQLGDRQEIAGKVQRAVTKETITS